MYMARHIKKDEQKKLIFSNALKVSLILGSFFLVETLKKFLVNELLYHDPVNSS